VKSVEAHYASSSEFWSDSQVKRGRLMVFCSISQNNELEMQRVEGLRLAGLLISPVVRHFTDVKLTDTHVTATLQPKIMERGVHITLV
jgi:hypothetical protein